MQGSEQDARSFSELFAQLAHDLSLLFRQEAALAKQEFSGMLKQALLGAVLLVVGGLVASVGLVALLSALVLALALVMPHWAAALVVGLAFLALGGLGMYFGIRHMGELRLVPERTAQSLRASVRMVREKLS